MTSSVATINEYRVINGAGTQNVQLAFVTATIAGKFSKEVLYDEVTSALNGQARPVANSFQWLDDSHTHVTGFVIPNREVRVLETSSSLSGYREVVNASNIYIDDNDRSLWEMKEGPAGKYLSRQGVDDLAHLLENARVSPRGSTPRMYSIQQATPVKNHFVAYVNASRYGAEMDYGVCLSSPGDETVVVLSVATKTPVVVPKDCIAGSYELELSSLPSIKDKIKAASANDPILSSEEYWKLQYSYAPQYMDMVLKQVREMAAL